jgi:hypothetical protein
MMRWDTPLWPAGHRPLKGGDWQFQLSRMIDTAGDRRNASRQQISPLEGEMPGGAEGGPKVAVSLAREGAPHTPVLP